MLDSEVVSNRLPNFENGKFGRTLNLLLHKAENLADFGPILAFICKIWKRDEFALIATAINNLSLCYQAVALPSCFSTKPCFYQDESETYCFEEFCVSLGAVFPFLQSLPFSEFRRFVITNQKYPLCCKHFSASGVTFCPPVVLTAHMKMKVKVKLRFLAPSAGIAEIEQT